MKVTEITVQNVANFLRLETGEYEPTEIQTLLDTAKSFIKSYTGLDDIQVDEHEEFVHVVYILCQDMWDNRSLTVEKSNINKVYQTILDMHCINLL